MGKKSFFALILMVVSVIFGVAWNPQASWSAEPYVIGYIADITGPCQSFYALEAEGFRLYTERLNARGGINGHKIKLVMEDGKSNPARSAAIAKKMIDKNNVLGIWGLGLSSSQLPVFEIAKKEKVPVVCGYTCAADVSSVKPGNVIFATGIVMNPQFHPAGYAYAKFIQKNYPQSAKVALSGYATPGARVWTAWTKTWLERFGYKVSYESHIPPGTVAFSPWANKVAELQPDIYTHAEGGEVIIPFFAALEKAGHTKDMLIPYGVVEGDVVKATERLLGNGEWILWLTRYTSSFDADKVPEFQEIKKAMKTFGSKYPLSAEHAEGWTMARIMESALNKAGWPCTRSSLLSALEQTNLYTKGLMGGPIRFTPENHYGPTWWKAYRWNEDKKALVSSTDWFEVKTESLGGKL